MDDAGSVSLHLNLQRKERATSLCAPDNCAHMHRHALAPLELGGGSTAPKLIVFPTAHGRDGAVRPICAWRCAQGQTCVSAPLLPGGLGAIARRMPPPTHRNRERRDTRGMASTSGCATFASCRRRSPIAHTRASSRSPREKRAAVMAATWAAIKTVIEAQRPANARTRS